MAEKGEKEAEEESSETSWGKVDHCRERERERETQTEEEKMADLKRNKWSFCVKRIRGGGGGEEN